MFLLELLRMNARDGVDHLGKLFATHRVFARFTAVFKVGRVHRACPFLLVWGEGAAFIDKILHRGLGKAHVFTLQKFAFMAVGKNIVSIMELSQGFHSVPNNSVSFRPELLRQAFVHLVPRHSVKKWNYDQPSFETAVRIP